MCSHIKLLHTELSPVPTEARPRTSVTPVGLNTATPPHKMTPKRFLEYEKMREEAAIGELVFKLVIYCSSMNPVSHPTVYVSIVLTIFTIPCSHEEKGGA